MPDISLTRPPAWNALGHAWRELEARSHCSFFQSWSWVGCHAQARFPDPLLLTVKDAGAVVAMGLLNRRFQLPGGVRLWLNESGRLAMDRIHVEHNGLLIARDVAPGLLEQVLARLVAQGHHLVLSGVDAAHEAASRAAGGLVRQRARPSHSHWIDLAAVRQAAGGHLGLLSANTRQQIRRSMRRYEALGALRVERAATLEEAQAHFAALGVLHQQAWTRRGQPGAFANSDFMDFHHALLAHAWPRGEVELLRICAGARVLGYLYNFRWRNRVANYQSGFDYAGAESAHQKPGLTCHHLAVEMYAAEGAEAYDLLAGEGRYKTSLATGAVVLHWIELLPAASLAGLLHRARQVLRRG